MNYFSKQRNRSHGYELFLPITSDDYCSFCFYAVHLIRFNNDQYNYKYTVDSNQQWYRIREEGGYEEYVPEQVLLRNQFVCHCLFNNSGFGWIIA